MEVSFCIVNLNAKHQIDNCIRTIPEASGDCLYEIIVVDNNSNDGSKNLLKNHLPNIKLIKNRYNYGYTRAINQAINKSSGDYIAVVNPDTLLNHESISTLIEFLDENNNIGVVGPKILNIDGTFQKSCKRGVAKPFAVFCYFLGLQNVFPNNKKYAEYHLNYLHEDDINEVSGVSGSCMIIRKSLIDKIGLFDERYFAYQEDSDFCLRAIKANWKVYYNPDSIVTHAGGRGGSHSVPYRAIYEWHKSYLLYYQKFFATSHNIIFNIFFITIMFGKLIFSIINHFIKN